MPKGVLSKELPNHLEKRKKNSKKVTSSISKQESNFSK
jgi:hypothetical protein